MYGLKNIAVLLSKKESNKIESIEKWPLIQSFGLLRSFFIIPIFFLEMGFFTMKY